MGRDPFVKRNKFRETSEQYRNLSINVKKEYDKNTITLVHKLNNNNNNMYSGVSLHVICI